MGRTVQEYETVVSIVTYKCNNAECPKTVQIGNLQSIF
jgi:hypothetical protein